MPSIPLMIISAAGIIGVVFAVHELGHFVAAKLVGIRVVTFSLGFGPRLLKKRVGETTFCLSLLPLGGYVIPVSGREGPGRPVPRMVRFLFPLAADEREELARVAPNSPGTLARASFAAKLFFLSSGLLFNLGFAFGSSVLAFHHFGSVGEPFRDRLEIGSVDQIGAAADAGLRPGDVITAIDGDDATSWAAWREKLGRSVASGNVMRVTVRRGPDSLTLDYAPRPLRVPGVTHPVFRAGFQAATFARALTYAEAFRMAAINIRETVNRIARPFFSHSASRGGSAGEGTQGKPSGLVGSVIAIGFVGSQSLMSFSQVLVVFSIAAVLLNAVPYPTFDGGQILTLVIEKVRGRELPLQLKERLATFGLATSLALIFMTLGQDIGSLVRNLTSWRF